MTTDDEPGPDIPPDQIELAAWYRRAHPEVDFVPVPSKDEPSLSLDEGYLAAWNFIRQYYERCRDKTPEIFELLIWMSLDGPRRSSDPAQWFEWRSSVDEALAHRAEDFDLSTISPPTVPFAGERTDP